MFTAKEIEGFLLAARRGDVATVAALLGAGMPVNAATTPADSALCHAVTGGHAEVVRTLLHQGAEVNARDANGFTPLINAAVFGHAEVVGVLLEAGADPHFRAHSHLFRGNKTTTALEQARGNGHKAIVELLLQAGASPGPAEFAYDAVKRFAEAAAQPAYQAMLRLLAELCGHVPRRWARRKGVFNFSLKNIEVLAERYTGAEAPPADAPGAVVQRRRKLVELLQAEVRAAGYGLVLSDPLDHANAAKLRLFPSGEKYAVLAASATNGVNYGHSTRDVIAWLLDLDKDNPFVLTECAFDFLGGTFVQPIRNTQDWAEKMVQFCPDLATTPGDLGNDLERTQRFFFWWD